MKILFTGASSFTGYWFVRELALAGHEVTAVFRRKPDEYADPLRRRRVELASQLCRTACGMSFGDEAFISLASKEQWDLLAHHAAEVTDYKSPTFDASSAVRNNTLNLGRVLEALSAAGCGRVLLTGSVFEGGEGAGSEDLRAFSPYGLSKQLTAQVFEYYCARAGLALGKFVIPNPFGPYEEPRFLAYLLRSWLTNQPASCATPRYVRDNIHVSLLAKAYRRFAEGLPAGGGFTRLNPSGYVETQGAFAERVAQQMRERLNLPCLLELKHQTQFIEPRIRINTDPCDAQALKWGEAQAWDELARYYEETVER